MGHDLFEVGNNIAEKWPLDLAKEKFEEVLNFAEYGGIDCLCLQDAIKHVGMPYSTYYYLAKKFPVLELLKKDAEQAVIRYINKGALTHALSSTPSIFRMKQLGERDESTVNQNISGNLDGDHKVIFEDYDA